MSNRDKKNFAQQYYVYKTSTKDCTPEQVEMYRKMDAECNACNHKETRYLDDFFDLDSDFNRAVLESGLLRMKKDAEMSQLEDRLSHLEDAINSLPQKQMTLIVEIFFKDHTATEIAQRDGVAISTVTRHLNKALDMLKQYYVELEKK